MSPNKTVLLYKHQSAQQQRQLHLPSLSINNSSLNNTDNVTQSIANTNNTKNKDKMYTEEQLERMKLCGTLFDRKSSIKKEIVNEFFRREPCLYSKIIKFKFLLLFL
jgi:hypothetical protein